MLVIVNPYATTVSDRLKNLVVYALRGRYDVRAVDTEAPGHATVLCREAAHEGYDVVVAFGGDGTVNEAANGLTGSDTPLCCLPGGRANVWCRLLGIPADVVDATEHLLGIAHDWHPRHVDLGRVNDRHFLFSAGVGLDASVVERVDSNPRLKARLGEYYYAWAAVDTLHRRYLLTRRGCRPGRRQDRRRRQRGRAERGALHVLRRSAGRHGRRLEAFSGDLAAIVRPARARWRCRRSAAGAGASNARVPDHRRVHGFSGVAEVLVRSADERRLPLQVDGDYIGDVPRPSFAPCRRACSSSPEAT